MVQRLRGWWMAGVVVAVGCSEDGSEGVKCGAGTALSGDECVVSEGGDAGGPRPGEAGEGGSGGTMNSSGSSARGGSGALDGNEAHGGDDAAGGSQALAGGGGTLSMAGAPDQGSAGQGGSGDDTTLITGPLDCGSRDVTGATVITGPISQDSTWSGVIHLPTGISVHAEPTITIEPGTKIIVGSGATVEFGYQGSQATVVALGTAQEPIRFCGEAATAGYYAGVVFRSGVSGESMLRNVLIADAGQSDAGLTLEMPLVVQGVQVRNSAAYGVLAAGFGPGSSTLVVSGATKAAVLASAPGGLDVPTNSVLTGNQTDTIDLGFTSFEADGTFVDRGVPYRAMNDIKTSAALAPLVTIEPGVELRIRYGRTLDLGRGTLRALGTANEPIVVQGVPCRDYFASGCTLPISDNVGRGGRIVLAGDDHELNYVELKSLGWAVQSELFPSDWTFYGALSVSSNTPIKLDHVTVTAAAGFGIKISGSAELTEDSTAIAADAMNHAPPFYSLSLGCPQVMTLPADTVVTTSGTSVSSCSTDATGIWPVGAGPYQLKDFWIQSGGNLTLQAGTLLSLSTDAALTVEGGGTLNVLGTSSAGVMFAGAGWGAIVAEAGSTVNLDYATISGGGGTNLKTNIAAYGPISLTNSIVSNSAGWGLKKAVNDVTDYLSGNTFTNNTSGNVTNLP